MSRTPGRGILSIPRCAVATIGARVIPLPPHLDDLCLVTRSSDSRARSGGTRCCQSCHRGHRTLEAVNVVAVLLVTVSPTPFQDRLEPDRPEPSTESVNPGPPATAQSGEMPLIVCVSAVWAKATEIKSKCKSLCI